MPTRLVWNFEICEDNAIDFTKLPNEQADSLRWETRYFWQKGDIVVFNGLNTRLLDLTQYKIKSRQDCYYLLPNSFYNIKARRDELLYKPLLNNSELSQGFGKKINLRDPTIDLLPDQLTRLSLLEQVKKESKHIHVHKVALLYKFDTTPTTKLELARLTIDKDTYFSACIEGHSQTIVNQISGHLLPNYASSDYMHFLKRHYD